MFSLLILTAGCGNNPVAPADKNMEGETDNKKVLMVIAPRNFKDVEYSATRQQLEKNVSSIREGKTVGVDGTEVKIEKIGANYSFQSFWISSFVLSHCP